MKASVSHDFNDILRENGWSPQSMMRLLCDGTPVNNKRSRKSISTPLSQYSSLRRVAKVLDKKCTPISIRSGLSTDPSTFNLCNTTGNDKGLALSNLATPTMNRHSIVDLTHLAIFVAESPAFHLPASTADQWPPTPPDGVGVIIDLTESPATELSIMHCQNNDIDEHDEEDDIAVIDLTASFSKQALFSIDDSPKCEDIENKDPQFSLPAQMVPSLPSNLSFKPEILSRVGPSPVIQRILEVACLDAPLPNGWKLYAHQKEAVTKCICLQRSILAMDMGLGKTAISLVWSKAVSAVIRDCITVITAPCTLAENWKREAEMVGFHYMEIKDFKKNLQRTDLNKRPIILISSWAKIPDPDYLFGLQTQTSIRKFKFLFVADEAHAMQTLKSQRTQSALKLCLDSRCIGCVLSTGTPMKNGRPANILPLLIGIRHPMAQNKQDFEKRFCNARKTKFCPWDVSGSTNLLELKAKIESHVIRKTKEECLDLPPMMRSQVNIAMPEEYQKQYEETIEQAKIKKKTFRGGKVNNATCLEVTSKLRYLSSISKVQGCASLIKKHFASGDDSPIVVFVWFKETCYQLKQVLRVHGDTDTQLLTCECMTGDITHQEERQRLVDRFQDGHIDVLICTFGVGATGLTLTRSHTVVLLDRPWTPGDVLQAEDRIRRIGQKSHTVQSIWVCSCEMDKKLDKLLQSKDNKCQQVLAEGALKKFFPSEVKAETSIKGPDAGTVDANQDIRTFFGVDNEEEDVDGFVDKERDEKRQHTSNGVMQDLFNQLI